MEDAIFAIPFIAGFLAWCLSLGNDDDGDSDDSSSDDDSGGPSGQDEPDLGGGTIFDDFDGTTVQTNDGLVDGTEDDDLIYGGLQAAGEVDTIDAGIADDTINAGDGDDTVFGGVGTDAIDGGAGNDSLDAGVGPEVAEAALITSLLEGEFSAIAETSAQSIVGGEGNDTLTATDGLNIHDPGAGDDEVKGGSDSDIIVYTEGNDTLDGGDGADALGTEIADDLTVNLTAGTLTSTGADPVSVSLTNIEHVGTGSGDDTITGDSEANILFGGSGADSLDGAGGADTLLGGDGADTFVAGDGDTIADFEPAADFVDLTGVYADLEEARADLVAGLLVDAGLTINTGPGTPVEAEELTTANTGLQEVFIDDLIEAQ